MLDEAFRFEQAGEVVYESRQGAVFHRVGQASAS